MGSKPTAPSNESSNATPINHPKFQKIKLLNDKGLEYIQISVPTVAEQDIKDWEKNFHSVRHSDSLLLPISYQFKKTEMCGSNGSTKINYDNYPFLLKDEISDRKKEKQKLFENQELWYLTYVLLDAADAFHSKGKKVGDIQPQNIFINDNGQTKVSNQYSWPNELTNYQKAVFEKQVTYLAPQQMKDLHFGKLEAREAHEICESFSIGLTLLDSAILTDSLDLYDLSTFRFNYQKLDERLAYLHRSDHIDEVLTGLIHRFCKADPEQRLRCGEVYRWIKDYEQKIINLEPIQFQQVPECFRSDFRHEPGSDYPLSNSIRQAYPVNRALLFDNPALTSNIQSQLIRAPVPERQQSFQPKTSHQTVLSQTFLKPINANYFQAPAHQNGFPPQLASHQINTQSIPTPLTFQAYQSRPISSNYQAQPHIYKAQPASQIQQSNYQVQSTYQVQPSIYQGQQNVYHAQAQSIYQAIPPQSDPVSSISGISSNKNDQFRYTLERIEEQLALSRKMFPS